jgi:hypothetical protein
MIIKDEIFTIIRTFSIIKLTEEQQNSFLKELHILLSVWFDDYKLSSKEKKLLKIVTEK